MAFSAMFRSSSGTSGGRDSRAQGSGEEGSSEEAGFGRREEGSDKEEAPNQA